jgi:hypothetical protein
MGAKRGPSAARVTVAIASAAVLCACADGGTARGTGQAPTGTAPSAVYTGATTPSDLPPASASAEQVAEMYLSAAKSGNCALTRELTLGHTWAWCDDPKLVNYRNVAAPIFVSAAEAGQDVEDIAFDMDTNGSSDGTIPKGWAPWGLELTHTATGWRLWDQGTG